MSTRFEVRAVGNEINVYVFIDGELAVIRTFKDTDNVKEAIPGIVAAAKEAKAKAAALEAELNAGN